ncbi:SH3 domain-containing protein [Rivularia sp. UHCC 0363]|uniref:SH3 domain-containing protein n=1 Tax=Rivularia sp. UHCC 0363 TaxID=3110244 RepID=UPI002B210D82|nr:SH3 domain-containing protein [Rivularia sp. UHCC 0363]MEA5595806.1 SH3 domain-containing protein [Rivularia sp. UHCC 0363]
MHIIGIFFFSFGILLILFGISIFTPLFSWFGKRLNSSNSSFVNYNQPNSIRTASLFMGICFFVFGIFIAFASAALLNNWNSPVQQTVSPQTPLFEIPMHAGKNPPTPYMKTNQSEYKLNCPPDKDVLNMRVKANLNAQIIALIPCDAIGIQDKKERYFEDGVEWFLVEYQQNTGWVAGKYLEIQSADFDRTTLYSKLVAKKRP